MHHSHHSTIAFRKSSVLLYVLTHLSPQYRIRPCQTPQPMYHPHRDNADLRIEMASHHPQDADDVCASRPAHQIIEYFLTMHRHESKQDGCLVDQLLARLTRPNPCPKLATNKVDNT